LFVGKLKAGDKVSHTFKPDRHAWLHVAEGQIKLNGVVLNAGDGAAVSDESKLILESINASQFLLFDLN
jgi:redox-sensitive bicupin YhaK (pirin superfamily)